VSKTGKNIRDELLQYWETLPQEFVSSAETKASKDEILGFVDEENVGFESP